MFKVKKSLIYLTIISLLWQALVYFFNIPTYILPSPIDIFVSFSNNHMLILRNLGITILEILTGFLLANLASLMLVCIAFYNKRIENIIFPVSIIIKTIPIIAIAPIIILWFGTGFVSKVVIVILMCFFPSLINMVGATRMIDRNLFYIFEIYSASKKQIITKLIIPATLPYLFSSLKISSSLAVIGAIVAEFMAVNKGLGFLIMSSYYSLNMPMVFASTLLICLIGLLFYYLIDTIEKCLVNWQ